jgi:Icc-related predicted phosphoesterase
MKLLLLSDIHLEFGDYKPCNTNADIVILAGDIGCKKQGLQWAKKEFTGYEQVIYICGNHEFYGEKYPSLINSLRIEANGSNVTVLENEAVKTGQYHIFGCTLWSDMALLGNVQRGMQEAFYINDYYKIRNSTSHRKIRAKDTCKAHGYSLAALRKFLNENDPQKSIIVTHHAPSPQSLPEKYKNEFIRVAYASDLEALITEKQPALWLHGHIHQSFDYHIGKTRIICNPMGYVHEPNSRFNPGLVVDV